MQDWEAGLLFHKGQRNLEGSRGSQHKQMTFLLLLLNVAWAKQAGKDHNQVLQCC